MKFKATIETSGYDEFIVEADSIEEAQKNWSEHGMFQGDKCEEVMFGGYSEHVGEPEIEKIEDDELAALVDNRKTRKSAREIHLQINEFDGKYNIMVDLDVESHDVIIVKNNDVKLYNKHETIAKVNQFLDIYLSRRTRSDVVRRDEL